MLIRSAQSSSEIAEKQLRETTVSAVVYSSE